MCQETAIVPEWGGVSWHTLEHANNSCASQFIRAQEVLLTQLMGSEKPTVYSTVEVMVLWWNGYLMLSSLQKKPL